MVNRREALVQAGVVMASAIGALSCGAKNAAGQSAASAAGGHSADSALTRAAFECLSNGETCLQHCLSLLAGGDTQMGECGLAVRDMLAATEALAKLAAAGSRHAKAAAKTAMDACRDCEAACRKHAEHHATCKACADCCARTVAECQRFLA